MAQTNWAIKGTLSFAPQHHEVEDSYGNPLPLAGVKVLVEAKEIAADPTWDNWGEDVTNAEGGFRITNQKDRSPRMFRVRAMFKNDDLKIYPPNTGLLSQAIDEAISRKPKGHDFVIDRRSQRPAVARHMSVTGG